jgi:hypothetical protein|tara:strand:- start:834 stop:1112 length:279 start_codon:yes stop_codon:yes gene_type:complete
MFSSVHKRRKFKEIKAMNKKYYLSLPYDDKIKKLKELLDKDFASYIIVSRYYIDSDIDKGGLSASLINTEFELEVKRKHYWNQRKQKQKKYD